MIPIGYSFELHAKLKKLQEIFLDKSEKIEARLKTDGM